jgi:hypothetical protein
MVWRSSRTRQLNGVVDVDVSPWERAFFVPKIRLECRRRNYPRAALALKCPSDFHGATGAVRIDCLHVVFGRQRDVD